MSAKEKDGRRPDKAPVLSDEATELLREIRDSNRELLDAFLALSAAIHRANVLGR